MRYITKEELDELPGEAVIIVSWRQLAPAQIHSSGSVKELWPTYSQEHTRMWFYERCPQDVPMPRGSVEAVGDEVCDTCHGPYQGHPFCTVLAGWVVLCDGSHFTVESLLEAAHAQR